MGHGSACGVQGVCLCGGMAHGQGLLMTELEMNTRCATFMAIPRP